MYKSTVALAAFIAVAQASPLQPVEKRDDSDTCVISAYWHHVHTITPDLGSGSGPIDNQNNAYGLRIFKNGVVWYNDTKDSVDLLGSSHYTLKTTDTGLSEDVAWKGSNFDGWQWCECTYGSGAKNHSTDITKGGDVFFTTTQSDEVCNCGFPCGTGTAGPQALTSAASIAGPSSGPTST